MEKRKNAAINYYHRLSHEEEATVSKAVLISSSSSSNDTNTEPENSVCKLIESVPPAKRACVRNVVSQNWQLHLIE